MRVGRVGEVHFSESGCQITDWFIHGDGIIVASQEEADQFILACALIHVAKTIGIELAYVGACAESRVSVYAERNAMRAIRKAKG